MKECSTRSVYNNTDSMWTCTDLAFRQPIVTGTSVLALVYKDGIMMAADNLGALL